MSVSSDFNMLWLEAPRDVRQITDGTRPEEEGVEIVNPATWVRTLVWQQQQAESDLRRLTEVCGNTIDHTDQRIQRIERAYQSLAEGTRYVYDRMGANEEIAEIWVHSELASTANAYQTFAREVWQAIVERTNEATERQVCQATQLARVNDALAFLGEANTARSQHLATFQGNIELWAAKDQARVSYLENQLQKAQEEIRKVADRVPISATPTPDWRSPAPIPSTSAPSQPPNVTTRPMLGSPLRLSPPAPLRGYRPSMPPGTTGNPFLPGPMTPQR